MKNFIGTFNQNYKIIKQAQIDTHEYIVLAYNDYKKEWATWRAVDYNGPKFYNGHYIHFNETQAILEFYERIQKEIEYKVLYYQSKLTYQIRNEMY